MFHNQVQQVQQKLNTVQQMCAQMRQSEQNNQHKLQQIAQEEATAAQQLQRVQQIAQECISSLQNISFSTQQSFTQPTYAQQTYTQPTYAQPTFAQGVQTQTYQPQNYAQTSSPISHSFSSSGLFDQRTMEPETYLGTLQTFGQNPVTQQTAMYSGTIPQQSFQTSTSGSTISNIATMNPDVYMASREQLGRSMPSLQQIGQQAGVTASSMASPTGSASANISQPSGILNRGFNQ